MDSLIGERDDIGFSEVNGEVIEMDENSCVKRVYRVRIISPLVTIYLCC